MDESPVAWRYKAPGEAHWRYVEHKPMYFKGESIPESRREPLFSAKQLQQLEQEITAYDIRMTNDELRMAKLLQEKKP